jgi:hypothetical protein
MKDKRFEKCLMSDDGETCFYHNCDAHEQCGKLACPHCLEKTEKLELTNSYLKAKDRGETA